jgi:hypothetical protein
MAALEAEKFPFATAAGTELLDRALRQDVTGEDAALARLVELGVPLVEVKPAPIELPGRGRDEPALQAALRIDHPSLAAALIEKGALETNGRLGQAKLDGAFRAAIEGANLPLMKFVWDKGGDAMRSSLQYEDVVGDDPPARKIVPATLLLGGRSEGREWDLTPIAEWLIAHGCDVYATRADGANLLHNAAGSDDVKFTHFLLLKKLDPSNLNSDKGVPLGATHSEEVALALLAAGTDLSGLNGEDYSFRKYATANSWYRVLAWLDAHGN